MSGKPEKQEDKPELMFRHTAGQANRFASNFDSHFTRIIGRGNYGSSAVGECYETASRIVDGDFQSYTNAWEVTAKRVEAIGWDCLGKGHQVSARDAFLRATTYWGASTMYVGPADPRQRTSYEKARTCFREAAKLFTPPIEVVNIPYEKGRTLPGYFIRGGAPGEKRPTVLVLGGGDSALEELYGVLPAGALRRGYNALMFEVPGQKAMFFDYPDLFFRADAEVPIRAVVDYALSRPEVHPGRVALMGGSFGGYFAPRAAAFEKRLAAVIALPLFTDIGGMFIELLGLDPAKPYPRDLESRLDMSKSLIKTLVKSDVRMRSGYANATIAEWLDAMRTFSLVGLEKNITCPLLVIAGESEFDAARAEKEKLQWRKAMNHPMSKAMIVTASEGGEGHCMVNNLLLANQIELDWLDEVIGWKS
ncbi:MAG: alpha/beta hydrolase family protein [Solirubrobacteraceae bacterium]